MSKVELKIQTIFEVRKGNDLSMQSIKSNCVITELTNESLLFAYENARKKNLDLHFIQLLEEEIAKRQSINLHSKKIPN
ncbi:sporulation histidine kinase inhibitor Sda [Bacillus haimaensis]|uniref:sporulation histidine kinase inhibitor Sda n=1 Tax=Bacillus haimaensis TaxID=3160967 RepID=UPI003AA8D93B